MYGQTASMRVDIGKVVFGIMEYLRQLGCNKIKYEIGYDRFLQNL